MTNAPTVTRLCPQGEPGPGTHRNAWASGFRTGAVIAALVWGSAATADAQVTASQGEAPVEAAKRFASPMVLTIPLPGLTGAKDLRGLPVAGIRSYRCEDASIASMTVSVSTARKGARTYEFGGLLLVDESFDRLVSLHLELRDAAGKALVSGRQNNISVEEGKSARFLVRSEVGEEQVTLIDGSGDLALQVTMYVRKD